MPQAKPWFSTPTTGPVQRVSRSLSRIVEALPTIAEEVATQYFVVPVQRAVVSDRRVNGIVDREWDFRSAARSFRAFEEGGQVYVGARGKDARRLLDMEHGDESHAPTGLVYLTMRDNLKPARAAFMRKLRAVVQ